MATTDVVHVNKPSCVMYTAPPQGGGGRCELTAAVGLGAWEMARMERTRREELMWKCTAMSSGSSGFKWLCREGSREGIAATDQERAHRLR